MKKTSRRATIVLCLVGFVFISIGAILFIMDYDGPGGGPVKISPSPTYLAEISPSPTYFVEPSLSTPPSDKVSILGVELPATPGKETVDEYGPGLHYPEKSEYLDDYQIKYIDTIMMICNLINLYSNSINLILRRKFNFNFLSLIEDSFHYNRI